MSHETIFEKIRFKNFQSFGQQWTEIDLTFPGLTFIVGENLDDGGSSGAGKTTLMSVVSYCLYDKIPSGVSKDRMINTTNGKKNTSMVAECYFSRDGVKYKIQRSRGQETGVHLYEDGRDITPASVNEANAAIVELVGFSYGLFSQIVLFSGNSRPFLDLSAGEQRALIEELFKITVLTKKAVALKRQMSETTKQVDMAKLLIQQQEAQNENYRKRVVEADRRVAIWNANQEMMIQNQEKLLEAVKNIDFDTEEQIHARIVEVDRMVSDSRAASKQLWTEKNALRGKSHPKAVDLATKKRDLTRTNDEYAKNEKDLAHLVESKCPYCLQDYAAAQDKIGGLIERQGALVAESRSLVQTIKGLEEEIGEFAATLTAEICAIDLQIATLDASTAALSDERSELSAVLSYQTYKDHVNAKAGISAIEEKIAAMKLEVNPHIDALSSLDSEGEVQIDYDSLNKLVSLREHQAFMAKLLTDKNSYVRKNLIATTTPFLNKRIGYYLQSLNLPHVVLFQPDMTCEISQFGRGLDHGNLSNGEKKRLNLALCLSFRDVLTYLHSKVNVLLTDEIDGGSLDSNCLDHLISLMKRKAWDDDISVFIVSHRPEFEGRCDRTFTVRKEGGFSSLIAQTDG